MRASFFIVVGLFISFVTTSVLASAGYPDDLILAYVTDLEGSRPRFEHFMSQSPAFELGQDGRYHVRKNAVFVFGGDAPDRYVGSMWVVAELVRLKTESPNRVVLIMGNRDINKMRLSSELSTHALVVPAVKFHSTNRAEWEKHQGPESASKRLKFILAETMGSPDAFDFRRVELAMNQQTRTNYISDAEVAESYQQELGVGGTFRRLLKFGQLAHRVGNTLFLHGGVTPKNFKIVPGSTVPRARVNEWIKDLNAWYSHGVRLWEIFGSDWNGRDSRPHQSLLDYSMPDPGMNSKPESVVTGRNSDKHNNPVLPAPEIIQQLLRQGIQRVVVGHTPTGSYAVMLRTQDDRFEVISADNSRSSDESGATILHFTGKGLRETSIRGTFRHNNETMVAVTNTTIGIATPLGKKLNDDIILANLESDPNKITMFRYGDGFSVNTSIADLSEINLAKLKEATISCDKELSR